MTIKCRIIFRWYDAWVGLFFDRSTRTLYVFPVPMIGLELRFMRGTKENDWDYLLEYQKTASRHYWRRDV